MSRIKLPYIHQYRDRHGRVRRYFRRGVYKVPLPGLPGSPEFMDAYRDAVEQHATGAPVIGARRTKAGSIDALDVAYYSSTAYMELRDSTKATYRNEIERLRAEHGDKPATRIERRHVVKMIAAKRESGGPESANNRLRVIRLLMSCAIEMDWRDDNPTLGIKKIASKTGGFHSWTDAELAAYEDRWPIGTRQRLAFALLLYTGQRRSDVVTMGRQHVRNGAIDVKQQKTGKELTIPLHPALTQVLDAAPRDHLTYLTTAAGKPFTPAGFGNAFREWCDAAGLKQCSAHGLRKAAARRLAEAGCTAHQIGAITGHDSLQELEKYTRAAEQKTLARAAINTLSGTGGEQAVANLAEGSQNPTPNALKANGRK